MMITLTALITMIWIFMLGLHLHVSFERVRLKRGK